MTGLHYKGKISYEISIVLEDGTEVSPDFTIWGKDFLDALDKAEKYCNRHFPTWKQVNLI